MSGLEAIGTVSALLGIIDVARRLSATFQQVPDNEAIYFNTAKNILKRLELAQEELEELSKDGRQYQINGSKLQESLSQLLIDLERLDKKSRNIKKWWNSEAIKEGLLRLDKDVDRCCSQFVLSAIARTERRTVKMDAKLDVIMAYVGETGQTGSRGIEFLSRRNPLPEKESRCNGTDDPQNRMFPLVAGTLFFLNSNPVAKGEAKGPPKPHGLKKGPISMLVVDKKGKKKGRERKGFPRLSARS